MATSLVILAAGIGSRYGGMKQLAEAGPGGHALMDYAVYDAARAGFERIVVVVSDKSEPAVRAHAEDGFARAVETEYARQDTADREKPWGTGHAVLSARPHVDGPFGVVNADDYYGRRSFELLREGLAADEPAHVLIGYTLRSSLSPFGGVSRGLCVLDGERLRSILELHDVRDAGGTITSRERERLTGDEVISTNLWGFRPGFFDVLAEGFAAFRDGPGTGSGDEYLIGDGVATAIQRGPGVRVVRTSDPFVGVTYPDDLPAVRQHLTRLVQEGIYPERLWEG